MMRHLQLLTLYTVKRSQVVLDRSGLRRTAQHMPSRCDKLLVVVEHSPFGGMSSRAMTVDESNHKPCSIPTAEA